MKSVHIGQHKITITQYSNEYLLLHSETKENLIPLSEAIYNSRLEFAEEVIGTEDEICIKLSSKFDAKAANSLAIIKLNYVKNKSSYKLPIYFTDHKDWSQIENYSNKKKSEIIQELTSLELTFHMYGFLPGFLYIKGLPPYLHCPRKAVPDKRVEAGTFAIGGPYLGLYSNTSPGGWHSIGACPLTIFDPQRQPPTELRHGDRINLISLTEIEYAKLSHEKIHLDNYG